MKGKHHPVLIYAVFAFPDGPIYFGKTLKEAARHIPDGVTVCYTTYQRFHEFKATKQNSSFRDRVRRLRWR